MEKLKYFFALGFAALCFAPAFPVLGAEKISYNRDIRPILSDNCFHCHGPDQKTRKGKFRLDVREDAVAKGAIVPGKPKESKLVARISATNQDDVMPPLEAHKTLTAAQKDLLRRWISNGAVYEKHWAYVPPEKPVTPPDKNAIDVLVRQRLRELGLKPSPPADRRTLARRLYFDLIGLPPKPEEVEAFENDKSPDAAAKFIDRLLASPQFGERMAIGWLDVARFADTIGYHSDNPRNIWPYRDYVIKAFNENKPFDQFTREQLAGDLLPNSTREQKIASAFNRLLLTTEEGGAQPKDYETRMLTDRVRAVSAIWLGQTIGCAQCHDHKFDPIKQHDFYSLGAFFADIEEPIIGGREPGMLVPNKSQEAELKQRQEEIDSAQRKFDGPHPEWRDAFEHWQDEQMKLIQDDSRWVPIYPDKVETLKTKLTVDKTNFFITAEGARPETDAYTLSFKNADKGAGDISALRIEVLPHDSLPLRGPGRADNGNFVLSEVTAEIHTKDGRTNSISFASARADFEQNHEDPGNPKHTWSAASLIDKNIQGDQIKGWAILPQTNQTHQIVLACAAPFSIAEGETLVVTLKQNLITHQIGRFRIGITTAAMGPLPETISAPPDPELADMLLTPARAIEEGQETERAQKLFDRFKKTSAVGMEAKKKIDDLRKARNDFEATVPRCLVSRTNSKPRTVRVLSRGNFLDETGPIVQPALPVYLAGTNADGRHLNRLDLANWLVSRDNPLTARVVMNRLWKQFFGLGLSKVVDDLGAQGESPPNQALLDWLACEFMDSGWDVKHMVRLIVNSETYQQSSVASKKLRARDPLNRELAVQSRWRLDAEFVRDNALAVSGLLVDKVGGPSVKPYQPDGYWENLNFPARTYEASAGEDQYRRGLYTWWQRSFLHPSLLAFDAPTREECAAERNRSNIPQQALVLLNDPTYVEASRVLAERMLKEGGTDAKSRLVWAWRQVLSREPRSDEIEITQSLLSKEISEYRADPSAAEALLKTGISPAPKDADTAELAAWTNIARVILNLHETITRS